MIDKIKITPIGGVGEVGALNCMVYETDTEAIVVDCGLMFPDQQDLGVDLIIPDFSYLKEIESKLVGVIFTHGHEDHIGSIPFLLQEINLPIYGSPFTIGLIKKKIEEYSYSKTPKLTTFLPGDTVTIGSFEIETLFVNHSIIDACCLVFKTKAGSVVHLTDWKIDKTPSYGPSINLKRFGEIGKKGVLALLSDSTNVGRKGKTVSEKEVTARLKKMCEKYPGRIIVTLFASNINRVQALAVIAKKMGRQLVLVGRSMKDNTVIARELGQLSFDGIKVVDVEEIKHLPPEKVMLLVTGTQGEPRSVLFRMAFGEFKPFKIQKGDLVLFSSRIIPGNEKNIFNMINQLCRHGAKVVYESFHDIHTSGHAQQDEIKEIIKLLKPKHYVPIHGEYRHFLKQAELAIQSGVKKENVHLLENGDKVLFSKAGVQHQGKAPVGRVFVDGSGVGDVCDLVIRDRRQLADTGIVICFLMIDRKSGEIIRGPELTSKGFITDNEKPELLGRAKQVVVEILESFNFEARTDFVEVQEEVRLGLQRFFRREKERKPVVIPLVYEV